MVSVVLDVLFSVHAVFSIQTKFKLLPSMIFGKRLDRQGISGRLNPSQLPWKWRLLMLFSNPPVSSYQRLSLKMARLQKGMAMMVHHRWCQRRLFFLFHPKSKSNAHLFSVVNDEDLKPETKCTSNASCTTNCLAPVAKTINDAFGIKNGFMTTVHSNTNDQVVTDVMHKDLRRARAACMNIIPTSTGAAIALPRVVKALPPKSMDGLSLRVPTITGSLVDVTMNVKKEVTKEEVNEVLKKACESEQLKGIMKFSMEPLVSSDIIDDPHSSIVDGLSTMVLPNPDGGSLVKVLSWYDNEWMYSCRCADIFHRLGKF
ncbi:glyceraldehyde-3-phosphate dehydrogenase [Histomonas meleagridis]|nr:glyceraldehyde-3-phosphate dehydrogenase [Histomonas meleagridis]